MPALDARNDYRGVRFGTAWLRFCAGIVDTVVFLPVVFLLHFLGQRIHSPALLVTLWLVEFACVAAYSVLLHGYFGQTLGKMLLKVKVLDVSESPLSMRQALIRYSPWMLISLIQFPWIVAFAMKGGNILHWNADLPMPPVVTYLVLAWAVPDAIALLLSSKRRALHDLLAGSVVVRTEVP